MNRLLCFVIVLCAVASVRPGLSVHVGAAPASPSDADVVGKSVDALSQARTRREGKSAEFHLIKSKKDGLGKTHSRFRQTEHGVPVWGGEAIVHVDKDGSVEGVTDDFLDRISVGEEKRLDSAEAVAVAGNAFGSIGSLTSEPQTDLWIFRGQDRDHLVYRVQFERIDQSKHTAMPVYFVDAQTSEIVFQYDNFQTATGVSQYSGTVGFQSVMYRRGNYQLEDLTRMIGTFDYQNSSFGGAPQGRFSDADDIWLDGGNELAGIDAHWGATQVYDYYKSMFGRNGIDGNGGPGYMSSITGKRKKLVTSGVHYGYQYANAGWTGSSMIYGDGDGVTASELTTLDIAGHEFTHGVTQYEANLIYSGESGALNEAISDMFGAMIESRAKGVTSDTWKIGEECWTPGIPGDALRYMDEPHRASNNGYTADDDPDHYSERYTGTVDNGGVHTNSGIANKEFYLLAMGGQHHLGGSMTGIGTDAAARIWYQALSNYMTSSTNFSGARAATLQASNALYGAGSPQSSAVEQSWNLVGVF